VEKVVVDYDYMSQKLEDRKSKIVRCFKTCLRCEVIKPIYQFTTDKRNTNGRTNICKKCKIIEYLKYYYENKDRILIVNKRYRDTHKGYRRVYYENYQKDHKEHLQVVAKKWYKKNSKRIKERNLKLKGDKKGDKKMNYYICLNCDQKYCGWAVSEICQKCGGVLEPMTREEFYLEKKRVVIEEEV